MFDFFGVSLLLLLVLVFGWLASRAWRVKRPVLKWLGATTVGLLTLVLGVLLGAALFGYWKLNRSHDNPVAQFNVSATPEQIARGEQLGILCAECHAPEAGAPMTGKDFLGEDAPPIGEFYAPNLTPAHLAEWSDGEVVRAIREGVHKSGRSLLIMPSEILRNLSDEDVQAIVAYLRSLKQEGVDTPPNQLNVLGAIMVTQAPIFQAQPPITDPVLAPPAGPTAAYGAYLSSFTCAACHGADLLGDAEAPSLLAVPLAWGEQSFIEFMRTGVRPDGSSVDGEAMPWKFIGRLITEDGELRAIYAHLQEESEGLGNRGKEGR